jgi:hypothetical protein
MRTFMLLLVLKAQRSAPHDVWVLGPAVRLHIPGLLLLLLPTPSMLLLLLLPKSHEARLLRPLVDLPAHVILFFFTAAAAATALLLPPLLLLLLLTTGLQAILFG